MDKLERLEKQKVDLVEVVAKLETRLNNLLSSAFSLANYYFVFQGVILTIVCNGAKNLKPSDRWFLCTISILAVSLNLFALILTGIKYIKIKGLLEDVELSRDQVNGEINLLKQDDHGCSEEDNEDKNEAEKRRKEAENRKKEDKKRTSEAKKREHRRHIYLAVCMILFLSFAVIILAGCWIFLGDRNEG